MRLAREVMEILGEEDEEDNLKDYLENLISINDACVEELEDEERFNSLRILGFVISRDGVNNLIVLFLSIGFTAYEMLGGKN